MRVVVAEADALDREQLRQLLAGRADVEVLAWPEDPAATLRACGRGCPDLLLLGLGAGTAAGRRLLRAIASLPHPPKVAWCLPYGPGGLAPPPAATAGCLVKPVTAARLGAVLDAVRGQGGEPPGLEVWRGPRRCRVPLAAIACLQAGEKYVTAHLDDGQGLLSTPPSRLEADFPGVFLRLHRSCLVPCERLLGLQRTADGRWTARVRGMPAPLPVSRRCLPRLRHRPAPA